MLVDTDVLIWYMRGDANARNAIDKLESFQVSVVTYMELVQGLRNKRELNELRRAFREWNADVLYINEHISTMAVFYIEKHYLSHSLEMADAMVVATAVTSGLPLLTGNDKHYRVVKEVDLKRFRPANTG